jgi:hypothetical protein
MFVLTDTEELNSPDLGAFDESEEETCFLNHSQLGSMSCGSLAMAWGSDSELEAEGMQQRASDKGESLFVNEI